MALLYRRRQFTHGPPIVTYLGQGANGAFIGTARVLYRGLSGGQGNLGTIDNNKLIVGLNSNNSGAVPAAASINGRMAPVYGVTGGAAGIGIFCALVPDDGSNPIVDVRFGANPSGTPNLSLYSIVGLSSPLPRSIAVSNLAGADTVRTVDVDSEVGGVIVAMAANNVTAAQSCTWTGDQTLTENVDGAGGGGHYSAAMIQGTNADVANTITATFAVIATTGIGLLAAAFR